MNEEIRDQIRSGKTVHQVAAEMGTTVSQVVRAISAAPPIDDGGAAGMEREDLAE